VDVRFAAGVGVDQRKWYRPSAVPPALTAHTGLFDRALCWSWPWTRRGYPGLRRGLLASLPGSYTWPAVRHWRTGRTPIPAAVADAMAAQVEARCEAGLALVAELRAHAAAQRAMSRPARGCCQVDASTGRDRRGNWRAGR
jgi:hypothetical protein